MTSQIREPMNVDFNQSTGKVERMQINPIMSLIAIEFYLSEYCTDLRNRDNAELREKFDQAWNDLIDEE